MHEALAQLTLTNNNHESANNMDDDIVALPAQARLRPSNTRSSTEPGPAAMLQNYFKEQEKHELARPSSVHRNRSPYNRTHLRSRSSGAALMTRAHSMPMVHTQKTLEPSGGSSASLSSSPSRARSPFAVQEEAQQPVPRSPSWYEGSSAIEAIQEDSELNIAPRQQPQPHPFPFTRSSSSLRRRPTSPLHAFSTTALSQPQAPTSSPANNLDQQGAYNSSTSTSSSPSLGPQRYNETYPSLHHYASTSSFTSSMPSTPTSARSRSPSISSLDTIEDAPEMEHEAAEDAKNMPSIAEDAGRRSLDSGTRRGFGRGGVAGERKRWSVCGGERRGDLDLETIWED